MSESAHFVFNSEKKAEGDCPDAFFNLLWYRIGVSGVSDLRHGMESEGCELETAYSLLLDPERL